MVPLDSAGGRWSPSTVRLVVGGAIDCNLMYIIYLPGDSEEAFHRLWSVGSRLASLGLSVGCFVWVGGEGTYHFFK